MQQSPNIPTKSHDFNMVTLPCGAIVIQGGVQQALASMEELSARIRASQGGDTTVPTGTKEGI